MSGASALLRRPGIRSSKNGSGGVANRDYQELFATELENALHIAAVLPGAGTPYRRTAVDELRRIYLRKLACHLYYTVDDHEVIVRALWGARRERGPIL